MKKIYNLLALTLFVVASSCSSSPSMQKYFVDNADNSNFLSIDIPTSVLTVEDAGLSESELEALESIEKLNILAFKKTADNGIDFETEKATVKGILADPKFTELMKMNLGFANATIKYLGTEDAIDEVIIYGSENSKGFAVIRVLGNDIKPSSILKLVGAIKKTKYNGKGLQELGDYFK